MMRAALSTVRAWVQARALAILAGALIAALVGFGIQTVRVSSLKADNVRLAGNAKAAKEAAALSEALRAQEQVQDKASFAAASERCEQRVATAIDAARAIEEVTNATVSNVQPAGGADRAIVPAAQLRRIIGQAQGAATGVSAGSNGTAQP